MNIDTKKNNYDLLIIGGGIVGISAGISALEQNPSLDVLIIEKENNISAHASGRNSGVLHAGFYYSPDSLKAQFCRDGNKELRTFATKNKIQINETGKVVVTRSTEELERLEVLFQRGLINGVELEIFNSDMLAKYEPMARTVGKFIWSPTTAVANPKHMLQELLAYYQKIGGEIVFETSTNLLEVAGEVLAFSSGIRINAKKIVNAAGAHADELAKPLGVGSKYVALPFRGNYRKSLSNAKSTRLIYPVPHPINPFLGVHTTITVDGHLKIGPTAMISLGRENYSGLRKVQASEMFSIYKAALVMARGSKHNLLEILRAELPLLTENGISRSASALSSEVKRTKKWVKTDSGIRSQLVRIEDGELVQDFIVERHSNSLHFLNIVSPGWTSALPFARHFIQDFLES